MQLAPLTLVSTAGFAALSLALVSTGPIARGSPEPCDSDTIARIAALDTAHLQKVERKFAPEDNTEGARETTYLEAGVPRIVHQVYFGESGRLDQTYFVADRNNYLVQREERRYAQPITVAQTLVVISRSLAVAHVCRGQLQGSLSRDDVAALQVDLDSAFARSRRAR